MLVHGGLLEPMDAGRFWVEPGIADTLTRDGFRTTIYDRRFSGGKTTAPIDEHSWDIEADDLLVVLATTDAQHTHIIAGSNGVSVAIRFAATYPARVRSLTLCWPTPPDNELLHAMFQQAISMIEEHGPSAYVDAVRQTPQGRNHRLLFRHLLERDSPVVENFKQMPVERAATLLARSEDLLLTGNILRGVSGNDLETVGQARIPTIVLPADPEDRFHTLAIAEKLASELRGANLVPGTPVSPSPLFADHLDEFISPVAEHLRNCG